MKLATRSMLLRERSICLDAYYGAIDLASRGRAEARL